MEERSLPMASQAFIVETIAGIVFLVNDEIVVSEIRLFLNVQIGK